MIHAVKTIQPFFDDTASGKKLFEVRINDREYNVGDFLAQNEYVGNRYTGRCMLFMIIYVFCDEKYCKDGYVVLGLEPCAIRCKNDIYREPGYTFTNVVPVYECVRL